ncbi:ATP-grasp domain-containing protein [Streptomyces sp. ZAF1911]|uniref:ATP-grasp domain-containing protein n=1 Tax=Streptomyces sp. ZAF1911 TaxID=2944129 RepID=UPI00237BE415|nr:ATP-grasp domain-containing protein [Streptomyces sp. ZAF1911]MDD9380510.1 ATP-grasp domain-containing protein [Streptomyces sp. ZAF1911]
MKPRVLVLGDQQTMVDAAVKLGAEVWWAQRPERVRAEEAVAPVVTLLTDYTDPAFVDLVAHLHALRPFDAVVSIQEHALLSLAALNERLGLRGPQSETARLVTDKWAMRARLAERGVSPVAAALGRTADDLRAFGAEHGFPFIAKPVAATGSFGVVLVDPHGVDAVAGGFAGTGVSAFLMEEHLDGPEISVETFSFAGRHVVLALTDKSTGHGFVESGHTIPATLDEAVRAEAVEVVGAFLDAVGLTDGPSHVEVKLTSAGPRIVEGHCRRGGDRINELVRLAYGVDMEELTVAWALGRTEPLAGPPQALRASAIAFADAPCGELTAVTGETEVLADPDVAEVRVLHEVGRRIGPVRWSGDRAGYVIATGSTPARAAAKAEASAARLVFTVTPPTDTGPADTRPAASPPATTGSAAVAAPAPAAAPAPVADRDLSRENDLSRHVGYERTDGVCDD